MTPGMKRLLSTLLVVLAMIPAAIAQKPGFTMWQLPSQTDNIGNSYVFRTDGGRIVVIDGGLNDEAMFLRGFLAALGNEVEAWIITHPHSDHIGVMNDIMNVNRPGQIKINNVYLSRFSKELLATEPDFYNIALSTYQMLEREDKHGRLRLHDLHEDSIGMEVAIDGLNIKILSVTNEEIRTNPYNNSSMVLRVWDDRKSILFLGDLGVEGCEKLYARLEREGNLGLLDCDYLQVAHHGQRGCTEKFYKDIHFGACLWSTPTWVWNNDNGGGPGSGDLKTAETRRWMDEIGIREHHVSCIDGIWQLD